MPTSLNKYLDPPALDETVLNIRQIVEGLEAEIQDLPYARPDGIYPDMTVGAVIGADSTAQWATRESTGTGSAIVRSVQGAAVVWNQLVPDHADYTQAPATQPVSFYYDEGSYEIEIVVSGEVTVSTDLNATQLAWNNITLINGHKYLFPSGHYVNNSVALYIVATATNSSFMDPIFTFNRETAYDGLVRVRVLTGTPTGTYKYRIQLFDLTAMFGSGNEPSTVAEFERMFPASYYPYSAPTLKPVQIAGIRSTDAQGGELDAIEWTAQTLRAAGSVADMLYSDHVDIKVGERTYQSGDESDSTVCTDGTTTYYPLATPTTTPISPALPMTYKVERGGSESIIVPAGEVSAAPVLTVAEPVNAGDEFARIWAAIESLGYTRNAAQLSRPVSLTDIGSIDESQKDTADVVEIETTKEVTE